MNEQEKEELKQAIMKELKTEFAQDIVHVKRVFEELIQRQQRLVQDHNQSPSSQDRVNDTSLEPIRERLQELNEALDRIKRNLD